MDQFSPGNINSLISKTGDCRNIVNSRKKSNPRVYRSTILTEHNSSNCETKRIMFK